MWYFVGGLCFSPKPEAGYGEGRPDAHPDGGSGTKEWWGAGEWHSDGNMGTPPGHLIEAEMLILRGQEAPSHFSNSEAVRRL